MATWMSAPEKNIHMVCRRFVMTFNTDKNECRIDCERRNRHRVSDEEQQPIDEKLREELKELDESDDDDDTFDGVINIKVVVVVGVVVQFEIKQNKNIHDDIHVTHEDEVVVKELADTRNRPALLFLLLLLCIFPRCLLLWNYTTNMTKSSGSLLMRSQVGSYHGFCFLSCCPSWREPTAKSAVLR